MKLERAKQHLEELKGAIQAFFTSQPYKIGTKRDPQTRMLIYYLTEVKVVPPTIAVISGDVIQNLRSTLDHLAYSLFLEETKGTLPGRHIYFPIEKDAATYEKEKARKTKGISDASRQRIDKTMPYKGGNDTLWQIGELNNIDKHRLLLTVGSSFGSFDFGAYAMKDLRKLMPDKELPDMPFFLKPADNLFPLKKGDELFLDVPDAEEVPNMQFRFEIVFHEPDIVEGVPVTEALQKMIDEVEKVVSSMF